MPKYGLHRYGRFKYGKYILSGGGSGGGSASLGPHVRYRMRTISHDGKKSDFLTMAKERVSIPSEHPVQTRIRANGGEWVVAQNATVYKRAASVRIRSVDEKGEKTPWVYGVQGHLSQ